MLQAALDLVASGWAVFPVQRSSDPTLDKRPFPGTHGVLDASNDPDKIREWWAKWPSANPAIAVPADCVVLDVDPRKGGDATLARLETEHGARPTLEVETGNGGRHLFYRVDANSVSNQVEVAPGLDTRTIGGYVVAAGAIHGLTGRPYAWRNELEPADAPSWLRVAARKSSALAEASALVTRPFPATLEASRVAALVELFRDGVWREGTKHAAAMAIGGYLHKRGFSWEAVEAIIRALPSKNPEARLRDARDAWNAGEGGAGVRKLQELSNADLFAELERQTANPKPLFPLAAPAASRQDGGFGFLSFEDLVDALPEEGEDPEFATGVEALDTRIEGGIREGNAVAIGAPPDGGKTQLLFQIAWNLAKQGVAVLWVALDEEPRRLAERGLQTFCDASRADARRPVKSLRARARDAARGLQAPIIFTESPLIEEAFAKVPELRNGSRAVAVIADSIQKLHVAATFGRPVEEMARLNMVCDAARHLSRNGDTRAMFLFSSEVSRTYYSADGKADPMGAFKGSSAIEYLATCALVLRRENDGQVAVEIAKSKIGGGGQSFVLQKRGIRLETGKFVGSVRKERSDNDQMRTLGAIVEAGPINAIGGPQPVRAKDVLVVAMRRRDNRPVERMRLHKAVEELKQQELVWISPDGKQILPTRAGELFWQRQRDPHLRVAEVDEPKDTS